MGRSGTTRTGYSRRLRARGAVLVEAIIVIPVLILMWGGMSYLYRGYQSKIIAAREAREAAWMASLRNCRSRRGRPSSTSNGSCSQCFQSPDLPPGMADQLGSGASFLGRSTTATALGPVAQADTALGDYSIQPGAAFTLPCNLTPGRPDHQTAGLAINGPTMDQFSSMFEDMFRQALREALMMDPTALANTAVEELQSQFQDQANQIIAEHCPACSGAIQGLGPALPIPGAELPVDFGQDLNTFLPDLLTENSDLLGGNFSNLPGAGPLSPPGPGGPIGSGAPIGPGGPSGPSGLAGPSGANGSSGSQLQGPFQPADDLSNQTGLPGIDNDTTEEEENP